MFWPSLKLLFGYSGFSIWMCQKSEIASEHPNKSEHHFSDFSLRSSLVQFLSSTLFQNCVRSSFGHILCSMFRPRINIDSFFDNVLTTLCVRLCTRLCFDHTLCSNLHSNWCSIMNRNRVRICFDHFFDYNSKLCSTERAVFDHRIGVGKHQYVWSNSVET